MHGAAMSRDRTRRILGWVSYMLRHEQIELEYAWPPPSVDDQAIADAREAAVDAHLDALGAPSEDEWRAWVNDFANPNATLEGEG